MRNTRLLLSIVLSSVLMSTCLDAAAEVVYRGDERLDSERPETWAMHYFTAASLMTGFGASPNCARGNGRWPPNSGKFPPEPGTATGGLQRLEGRGPQQVAGHRPPARMDRIAGRMDRRTGLHPAGGNPRRAPRALFSAAIGRTLFKREGCLAVGAPVRATRIGGRRHHLSFRRGGHAGPASQSLWLHGAVQRRAAAELLRPRTGFRARSRAMAMARQRRGGAIRNRSAGGCADFRHPRSFAPDRHRCAPCLRRRRQPRLRTALALRANCCTCRCRCGATRTPHRGTIRSPASACTCGTRAK